jgi:hypothetical protein
VSPQIAGVAAEGPGMLAVHLTFSVFENVAGSPVSGLDPSKFGPRQLGQFSA